MRLAIISAHLDDAVFSCGQALAAHPGSAVITAFAGRPSAITSTRWDQAAGFTNNANVIERRRQEDLAALKLLDATPAWLDFVDGQYRPQFNEHALTARLETELARLRAGRVMIPLGLHHRDHRRLNDVCMELVRRCHGRTRWFLYEDAIYRRYAGLLTKKLALLESSGLRLRRVALPSGAIALKRAAVSCYASQLKALDSFGYPGYDDVFEPEGYWEIQAA